MTLGLPDLARDAVPKRWYAVAALVVACAAWYALVRVAPSSITTQMPQAARALSAGLFLTAGILWLARWRIGDDAQSARAAAAAILLGGTLPVVALVGPLMQQPPRLAHLVPAGRLLLLVPVYALVVTSSRSARRRNFRPCLVVIALFVSWLGVTVALAEWHAASRLLPLNAPDVWLVAECVAAAMWLALAAGARQQARRDARPARNWIATALVLMALSELVRALSIQGQAAMFGIGAGLQLLAAAVTAFAATAELRESFRLDGRRSRALARALADVHQQLDEVQQTYRERLHDARTAVIGVVGASRLLSLPSETAVPDPQRLHRLMAAELGRLQETLDVDRVEPIEEFALIDALEPVVLSHRLAGGVIDVELGTVRVAGRPVATATALANLLTNSRTHAPGARVTVRALRRGPTVVLTVDDDGTGIAASDRERVLRRGARGSAPGIGSGLGLYTAATAMAGQSGTLRLAERPGGGTRAVLTMPAAAGHPTRARAS